MSKKDLDQFLGKKTKSPLNTDKIYGGTASKLDTVRVTERVKVTERVRVTVRK